MPIIPIDDLADPRLTPYRELKRSNLTRWSGHFIAEGWRVVDRLINSSFPVDSVLTTPARQHKIPASLPPNVPVFIVSDPLAQQLLGYEFHAGVMASGARKVLPSASEFSRSLPSKATVVVCPRITDPDNLGGIIRLCAGFNVAALFLGSGSADPFSRRTLRISMGHAFFVPIFESKNLAADLFALKTESRFRLAATVLSPTATPLQNCRRPPHLALLFGNEADGLDQAWIDLCDLHVTIPMAPQADSLNVTVAAGIFLHYFCHMAPPD